MSIQGSVYRRRQTSSDKNVILLVPLYLVISGL